MEEEKKNPNRKFKYLKDDEGYQRPKQTFTDQLTPEKIAEMLMTYTQVDDMKYVKKGTHLRYRIPDKRNPGEMKFCVGGFLKYKHDEYVILAQSPYGNNAKSWSVQLKGAIFYRKMKPEEMTERRLHDLETEINRLRTENAALKAKLFGPVQVQEQVQEPEEEFAPISLQKKVRKVKKKRVKSPGSKSRPRELNVLTD